MNNITSGKSYFEDAKIIFNEAKESFKKGHYHRTVRKCQESVELGLKGFLRIVGVEYPKSHRVGKVLVNSPLKDKVNQKVLKTLARIADMLAEEREVAFYGTEHKPAQELFTNTDAEEAIEDSQFVFNTIENAIRDI